MKIYLRDINPGMTEAWSKWFDGIQDVEISTGDIFAGPKADAIISPANSFGFMDGGIDLAYSIKFGWDLQKRLQKVLAEEHYGELPIGQAVIVPTENKDIPWCISAPTMRIPMFVMGTPNAYLAFRASLIAVKEHNGWINSLDRVPKERELIGSILCPGLGTAVGRMPFDVCAKQMFYAYMQVVKGEQKKFEHLGECVDNHFSLTKEAVS